MKRSAIRLILVLGVLGTAQPASLLTVSKTPVEAFNCSIDFTPVAGGDGISLASVTALSLLTMADTTAVVIAASPAPAVVGSSDVVVFRITGGANRDRHLVSVTVTDSVTGEIFQGQMTVVVNNGTNP